jgi:hypothetical protein
MCAGRGWWRGGEFLRVDFCLAVNQVSERGWVKPGWWDDVCTALFFEEEGEPEGEVGAVRRPEGLCCALWEVLDVEETMVDGRRVRRETHTQELDTLESLSWHYCHHLHLAEEGYLGMGEPRRQWEGH